MVRARGPRRGAGAAPVGEGPVARVANWERAFPYHAFDLGDQCDPDRAHSGALSPVNEQGTFSAPSLQIFLLGAPLLLTNTR